MKIELQEQLQQKYPQIFVDLWGDPKVTCMAWGIAVGPGWYSLIDKLCAGIMEIGPGPKFKAEQVKEKFGGLRFYVSGYPDNPDKSAAIVKVIDDAEMESYKTCEMCGTNNDVALSGAWVQALCGVCRVHRKMLEEDSVKDYVASREKVHQKRQEWLKKKESSSEVTT